MPDYKPNYFVRVFAVLALIVALIGVVVVIATTSGGSDDGDDGNGGADIGKVGRQAVRKGVWIVRSGDTLGEISLKTGIDETVLLQLNPEIDPQALQEGERIALR
jgi:LysM repeat protein